MTEPLNVDQIDEEVPHFCVRGRRGFTDVSKQTSKQTSKQASKRASEIILTQEGDDRFRAEVGIIEIIFAPNSVFAQIWQTCWMGRWDRNYGVGKTVFHVA